MWRSARTAEAWLILTIAAALAGCRSEPAPKLPPPPTTVPAAKAQPPADAESPPPPSKAADSTVARAAQAPEADGATLDKMLAAAATEQWYGVYMLGRKVGHARVEFRRSRAGEPGAYASITDVEMTVKAMGVTNRMVMKERRFYDARAPFPLIETHFEQRASGVQDQRKAVASQGKLLLERVVDGRPQPQRTLPGTRETLSSLLATMPLEPARLKPGTVTKSPLFVWQIEKDDTAVVRVAKVEPQRQAGIDNHHATLAVRYETMGIELEMLVADGGVVLKTTLGQGIEMKLEEKSVALSAVEGLNVVNAGVPIDRKLGPPDRVRRLELQVTVPAGYTLPATKNQEVTPAGDDKVKVVLTAQPGDPVEAAARDEALKEDAIFDLRAEPLQRLAKKLTTGLGGAREKVKALASWVYDNLEKRLATHLPTASKVLERKYGDCTEHTWLFVALARAAGVPARPVYGIAYVGDEHQSFNYHAWAEVELDGRWVAVDPTWDEAIADATHLRLSSNLHDVAAAMGGLRLEVVAEPVVDVP